MTQAAYREFPCEFCEAQPGEHCTRPNGERTSDCHTSRVRQENERWLRGRALLDASARRNLGIPGDEFVKRWKNGEWANGPDEMTTYRRADGDPVHDEYGWVTDLDGFDGMDYYEPVELVREVWQRSHVETVLWEPTLYECTMDADCDAPAVAWEKHGSWEQVCESHRTKVVARG